MHCVKDWSLMLSFFLFIINTLHYCRITIKDMGQTDGRTPRHYIDSAAYYASNVNRLG